MKISSTFIVVALIVIGFGAFVVASGQKNNVSVEGKSLPVEVEVFVDFNCPHCAEFEAYSKTVKAKFGDKVKFSLKNLPFLTAGQMVDTSLQYAYAALGARAQGKSEEYSELLFKWIIYKQSPTNTLFTYTDQEKALFAEPIDTVKLAEFLGLNIEEFNQYITSEAAQKELVAEKESAVKRMGAISTPAIFIYGQLYKLSSYTEFESRIESFIKEIESKK